MTIRHIYPCKKLKIYTLFKPNSIRGQKPGFPKLTRSLKSIDPEITEDGKLLMIYLDAGDGTYKAYEQPGPDGRSSISWDYVAKLDAALPGWNQGRLNTLLNRGYWRGVGWDTNPGDFRGTPIGGNDSITKFGGYFYIGVEKDTKAGYYWFNKIPPNFNGEIFSTSYTNSNIIDDTQSGFNEDIKYGNILWPEEWFLDTRIEKLKLNKAEWLSSDNFDFENVNVTITWDTCHKTQSASVEYSYNFLHKPPDKNNLKNQINDFIIEYFSSVSIIGTGYNNNYDLRLIPNNEIIEEILPTNIYANFIYKIIGINIIDAGNNYSYTNIIFPSDDRGLSAKVSVSLSQNGSIENIIIIDEGFYSFIPNPKVLGDGFGANIEVIWKADIVSATIDQIGLYKGLTNPIFDIKIINTNTNELYENATFTPSGFKSQITDIELTNSSTGWSKADYFREAPLRINGVLAGKLDYILEPNYPTLINARCPLDGDTGRPGSPVSSKVYDGRACADTLMTVDFQLETQDYPLITLFNPNSGLLNMPHLDIVYFNSDPDSGVKVNVEIGDAPENSYSSAEYDIGLNQDRTLSYTHTIGIAHDRIFPYELSALNNIQYINDTYLIKDGLLYKWWFLQSCDPSPNTVGMFLSPISSYYSPPIPLKHGATADEWRTINSFSSMNFIKNTDAILDRFYYNYSNKYVIINDKLYSFYNYFRKDWVGYAGLRGVVIPKELRENFGQSPIGISENDLGVRYAILTFDNSYIDIFPIDGVVGDDNLVYECPLSASDLVNKTDGFHMIIDDKLYHTSLCVDQPFIYDMPLGSDSIMILDGRTSGTSIYDRSNHSIRGLPRTDDGLDTFYDYMNCSGTKTLSDIIIINEGCDVYSTVTGCWENPWKVQVCDDYFSGWESSPTGWIRVEYCESDWREVPGPFLGTPAGSSCYFGLSSQQDCIDNYIEQHMGVEVELGHYLGLTSSDMGCTLNRFTYRIPGVQGTTMIGVEEQESFRECVKWQRAAYEWPPGYMYYSNYYCMEYAEIPFENYYPSDYIDATNLPNLPACASETLSQDGRVTGIGSTFPTMAPDYTYNATEAEIIGVYKNFQMPNFMVDIDYLEDNKSKYEIAGIPSYNIPQNLIQIDTTIDGKLIAVSLENNGYGYRDLPNIHIGGGAVVTGIIQGFIESIEIIDGGDGYVNAPTIVFNGLGVPPIIGSVDINEGKIIKINMLDNGKYRESPTIELTNESFINNSGTSAILKPIMNYSVIDIQVIDSGNMYQYAPDIVIESPDDSYTKLMNGTITRAEYDLLPQVARAQCSISGTLMNPPDIGIITAYGGNSGVWLDSRFLYDRISITDIKIINRGSGYDSADLVGGNRLGLYGWIPAADIYFDDEPAFPDEEPGVEISLFYGEVYFDDNGSVEEVFLDEDFTKPSEGWSFLSEPTLEANYNLPSYFTQQPPELFVVELQTTSIQTATFFKQPSIGINEIGISIVPSEFFNLKKTAIFLQKKDLDIVRDGPLFDNYGIVQKALMSSSQDIIDEPALMNLESHEFKAHKLTDLRFGFTNDAGFYWSDTLQKYVNNLSYDNINNPFYYDNKLFFLPNIRWSNFEAKIFDVKGDGATIGVDLVDNKINRIYFTNQGNELYTEDSVISISGEILFEPAEFSAVIDTANNSGVKNIIIENEGYGYIPNNSTISIDHNTGSGLEVKLSYYDSVIPIGIAGISIINPGSNYSAPPVITVQNRNNLYIDNLIKSINIQLRNNFQGSLSYKNIGGVLSYSSFCIEYPCPTLSKEKSKTKDLQYPYISGIDSSDESIFCFAYRHKGVKSINMFYDDHGLSSLDALTYNNPPTINNISSISNNSLQSPPDSLGYSAASGIDLPTEFINVSGSTFILYNY